MLVATVTDKYKSEVNGLGSVMFILEAIVSHTTRLSGPGSCDNRHRKDPQIHKGSEKKTGDKLHAWQYPCV